MQKYIMITCKVQDIGLARIDNIAGLYDQRGVTCIDGKKQHELEIDITGKNVLLQSLSCRVSFKRI